jgi:hypothetical protein
MLRTTVFVLIVGALRVATPAVADGAGPGPVTVTGDEKGGSVTTTVTDTGPTGSQFTSAGASSGVTCDWTPDDTDDSILESADPSSAAAQQYRAGGRYYNVICSDGSVYPGLFVPGDTGAPQAVTPGALAESLTKRLPLPLPVAQRNPSGDATTGLAVWFWVPGGEWRSLSQRTQAGPVWAQVTATPLSTTWDPGDGADPLVCAGPGTPYDDSRPSSDQSTQCSYTYPRSSAAQPQTGPDPNDRFFTVTVSVDWRVTWVGAGGASGQLPDLVRTATFQLRVDDRETVVTSGSG